jgi:hypothetical protein
MNVVKELTYVTESGEFSGYFKEDKGFAKTIQGWEGTVGITQHDPNYGARSVAMYRLDKLLGAEVTARAEFAANEGKLGTVIESAKGKAAVDTQFSNDEEQQQKSKGSVLTSDPVLQRAMNKLQILDAICGQLDRHEGNWFVETDEKTGKVKGVKGIDLDMAFGSEMKGVEEKDSDNAQNYLGMPEMIDDEFAQRIMLIRPDDIRNTLKGLLPDNEVEATVIRFTSVRAKIEQVAKTRGLTKVWDQSTANENRLLKSVMMSGHKSYGTKVNAAAVRSALDAMREDAIDAVNHGRGPAPFRNELQYMLTDTDLPEKTAKGLREALIYQVSGANMLKEAVWSGKVPAGKTSAVAMQLLNAVLNDADGIMTQLIIAVQEMDSEANPYMVLQPMLEKFMIKLLPALIANLPVNA